MVLRSRPLLTVGLFTVFCVTILSIKSDVVRSRLQLMSSFSSTEEGEDESLWRTGEVYHAWDVFSLNYANMERKFKVFIYPDGDSKTFYHTALKLSGKYASEGYFFQNIRESSNFKTDDPDEAHLFFIPISCYRMRAQLGVSYRNMTLTVGDYVNGLIAKYPYWNRTLGADHFFVTCQDMGVKATLGVGNLAKNSIRVVCSPSYGTGFIPHKDVALPRVQQPFHLQPGGNDSRNRTTLGFWAGHQNSRISATLVRVWENDNELDISNGHINISGGDAAAAHLEYQKRFSNTKFCICPSGTQVETARIADSIYYGCVPVILADYYDLPFNGILDWRKFAVILREREVYKLKQILKAITDKEYAVLQNNLSKVRRHFVWNTPPIKYDAFHMVMYELWLKHHVIKY